MGAVVAGEVTAVRTKTGTTAGGKNWKRWEIEVLSRGAKTQVFSLQLFEEDKNDFGGEWPREGEMCAFDVDYEIYNGRLTWTPLSRSAEFEKALYGDKSALHAVGK